MCPFQVTANYTIQILPSVLQDVFYELCGLTLRTIFDLRIPGAASAVHPLLNLAGETIATQALACPALNATATSISQGFGCAAGEVLRQGSQTLPECCKLLLFFYNLDLGDGLFQYRARRERSVSITRACCALMALTRTRLAKSCASSVQMEPSRFMKEYRKWTSVCVSGRFSFGSSFC